MDNKVKFAIPGLWNHYQIMTSIINIYEQHPEYFYDNISFIIYDNFPYCIWDGGRIFHSYTQASLEDIVTIRDFFNNRDIPIRLIFTNPVLEEQHLHDRFCNLVCTVCENNLNEIVVNSSLLENYLKKSYPKFNLISSTTKCNLLDQSLEEIEEANRYKYICLDYNQNKNKKVLESLSQEKKDKIEFLCNAICPPGCQHRKEHYRLNGLYYLNYMKEYLVPGCSIKENTLHPLTMSYQNNISPEEIWNYYVPNGFSMFKLEGRSLSHLEFYLNCIRYLVKPEYQFYLISNIDFL